MKVFMSVLRNSRSIRYSYNIYQHSPVAIKAASLVLYGLKCYLSLSRPRNGDPHLLYFASYPNEHRVLRHIRNNLQAIAHDEVTISLGNCFKFSVFREIFTFFPASARLYRFARRLVRKYEFMPACRIFSTVTYYKRFKGLLDEDIKAVFIACQYSPECLGLAAAAHRKGKKVLFTNHANATGETGYVAPLHADLVAVTSQAMADLYQRHSPHELDIVPFTIAEPQQPLQMPNHDSDSMVVGIYLTALTNEARLQEIVTDWSRLPCVGLIVIRTHPAQIVNADLSGVKGTRVPVEISNSMALRGDIERTDIAVCGNSTVVIEILRGGRPVLYDQRLDHLAYDYNGYAGHELVLPYPEKINDGIFEQIQQHYFSDNWQEKMRYFDSGYQNDEQAITQQFAVAVERLMQQACAHE
jgi:hypothetical protein